MARGPRKEVVVPKARGARRVAPNGKKPADDLFDDEVDDFHAERDKLRDRIALDGDDDDDESGDEPESDERLGDTYGLDAGDDDDDEDDEDDDDAEDDDDSEEEIRVPGARLNLDDGDEPDDDNDGAARGARGWGKKGAYYGADDIDAEDSEDVDDDEQAAKLEEEEARRLQAEQLRYRLEGVAREQARLVAEGWRVLHVEGAGREGRLAQTIDIDGQPFTLTGKIDRIDLHPELGYRVIDYKTSDNPKSPEQTHRAGPKGDKRWTDLQLPLYRDLCAALGVTGDRVALAYFNVPRKLSEAKVVEAAWDAAEIDAARAVRDDVVRALRAQRYWPPSMDPPVFDDGLAGVCADDADGRADIVQRSGVGAPTGEEGDVDA